MNLPKSLREWVSRISTIAVLALLVVGLYYISSKPVDSALVVRFLDIGQGDSELIQTGSGQNILIDGGPDSSVISRLDTYIPFYKRQIDAMILTHPHADHVDGLNDVLKKYEVRHLYFSGVAYTTTDYLTFLNLVKDKQIPTSVAKSGDHLELGEGVRLDFLYPKSSLTGQTSENMNNTSVVTRLVYGNEGVLFTGDLESEAQDELLQVTTDIQSAVYKAPHHGSKNAVNEAFFKLVNPRFVVIEVGKDNKFGHPSQKALDLFSGRTVLRTDEEGTVSFAIGKDDVKRLE